MSTNNIFNALSSPPPSDSNINGRAGNNDDLLHNASILAGDGNNKKKKKRKKKKKKKNVETGGCDVAIENSDAGTNLKNQINDAVKNNVFVQQKESAGYGMVLKELHRRHPVQNQHSQHHLYHHQHSRPP